LMNAEAMAFCLACILGAIPLLLHTFGEPATESELSLLARRCLGEPV
jgi:hypothetical protein